MLLVPEEGKLKLAVFFCVKDCLSLLMATSSKLFVFNTTTKTFYQAHSIRIQSLGSKSLGRALERFLEVGSKVRRLDSFLIWALAAE